VIKLNFDMGAKNFGPSLGAGLQPTGGRRQEDVSGGH
jgi:hypothetical protein